MDALNFLPWRAQARQRRLRFWQLGLALANSCEFTQMKQAQSDFEQNEAIAKLMQELNEKRERLISILTDEEGDNMEAVSLTNDIERLEAQLKESPLYSELMSSQTAFSSLLSAMMLWAE